MTTISHQEAKQFYDRLGIRQDWQAFYEGPAIIDMISHGQFASSHAVCEFGCGTAKLAQLLLSEYLPNGATYTGLDISETMVRLATARLEAWADRASVIQTDGLPRIPASEDSIDRVISTYVLDLLSEQDIHELLGEVRRVLTKDGLFCNVGLTLGVGSVSKAVTAAWQKINGWWPTLLGGCRPLVLTSYMDDGLWNRSYHRVICSFAICSEITVASVHHADSLE